MEANYNDDITKMDKIKRRGFFGKKKEDEDVIARPYLLRRFVSGLVDIIIILAAFVLIYVGCYYTLFKAFGYNDALQQVYQMNEDSHLYTNVSIVEGNTSYVEIEEGYDEAIIYFYTTDERAINDNKLAEYNQAKADSGLDLTSESEEVTNFYKTQYENATTYFKENPTYVSLVNKTYIILTCTLMIILQIVLALFYLVIPLCRKEGETLGQMLFKICLIDSRDYTTVKKWQIVIRYMSIVVINYGISMFIYFVFDYFTLLPALITLFMMSFTKKNMGPHDYLSSSHLILKHRADAMDTLKIIHQQANNQY